MVVIREYTARNDKKSVRGLLSELLDSEKDNEPEWPSAREIIDPYFSWMLRRCRKYSGTIFVAEDDGQVIGFVTVLSKMKPDNPGEYPEEYAFISELVLSKSYRSRGLGNRLISRAEDFARQKGASNIRLEASGGNLRGRRFYARAGYRELLVEYFKKLN